MSNLSVSRGEKLSTKSGAGLTAKGRAKTNRETGSNLKAPAPHPKTSADAGRKHNLMICLLQQSTFFCKNILQTERQNA
jgi:hypothetical protein